MMNFPRRVPRDTDATITSSKNNFTKRKLLTEARAAKVQDYFSDPLRAAINRTRQAIEEVSRARSIGETAWRAANDPVLNPLPAELHPQRAAAVRSLMEMWSRDHLAPIVPTPTIEEAAGEAFEAAKATLAEAEAEALAIERGTDPDETGREIASRRFDREIRAEAERLHRAQHTPVQCPSSGHYGAVHPDRARLVAEFLASIGAPADPLAPILPEKSVETIRAEMIAAAGLD